MIGCNNCSNHCVMLVVWRIENWGLMCLLMWCIAMVWVFPSLPNGFLLMILGIAMVHAMMVLCTLIDFNSVVLLDCMMGGGLASSNAIASIWGFYCNGCHNDVMMVCCNGWVFSFFLY